MADFQLTWRMSRSVMLSIPGAVQTSVANVRPFCPTFCLRSISSRFCHSIRQWPAISGLPVVQTCHRRCSNESCSAELVWVSIFLCPWKSVVSEAPPLPLGYVRNAQLNVIQRIYISKLDDSWRRGCPLHHWCKVAIYALYNEHQTIYWDCRHILYCKHHHGHMQ